MTQDDGRLRRRIAAVQLGLLAALIVLALGPGVLDLGRSMTAQLPVLLLAVAGALSVEHLTRGRGPGTAPGCTRVDARQRPRGVSAGRTA